MISLPNTQPQEKLDYHEDGSLDVVSVFQTIQGEGPLTGTPAVFVRLAGCNLICPACDTDYTTGRKRMSAWEAVDKVWELSNGGKVRLAVLTGGEPFRQNITPLVQHLLGKLSMDVQVETNGTFVITTFPYDKAMVVVSPKTASVHSQFTARPEWAYAYKYVLQNGLIDPRDGLPTSVLGRAERPARPPQNFSRQWIFVAPADEQDPEKNRGNVTAAVGVCLKYGYRLSLQTHKLLGLD